MRSDLIFRDTARNLLFAAACIFFVLYCIVAAGRMMYPYHLGWIEGTHVDEVRRLLEGKPLYVAPTVEYIPFIYTPLYFWVCALAAKVTGIGFFPLRFVSFLCSLATMGIIFFWVKKETRSRFFAFISACLPAAMFKISGSSIDAGAVDSLFLFLTIAGVASFRFAKSSLAHAGAGLLFGLAFLAKQPALVPYAALIAYCLFLRPRRIIPFAASGILVILASTWWLDRASGGWYTYYIFKLPRMGAKYLVTDRLVRFWTEDLWKFLYLPCVFAAIYLFFPSKKNIQTRLFYVFLLAGALACSFIVRSNDGGSQNAMLPAYAVLSVLFGLASAAAFNHSKGLSPRSQILLPAVVFTLGIITFGALAYNPSRQIPGKQEKEMGDRIIAVLKSTDGEIFASRYGHLPYMAGKKTYAHRCVIADLVRNDKKVGKQFKRGFYKSLNEKHFAAVLCQDDFFTGTIDRNYKPAEEIQIVRTKFWWPNADPISLRVPRE